MAPPQDVGAFLPWVNLGVMVLAAAVVVQKVNFLLDQFIKHQNEMLETMKQHGERLVAIETGCRIRHDPHDSD